MTSFPPYEAYREQWLESVRAGQPSTVQLGQRFAHKLITQWRDVSPGVEDIYYCDGAAGGIDLAFLSHGDADADSRDGDTWYLVQSKYGAAFKGPETLLAEGYKVIETLDGRRERLSSLASGLLERIKNFRTNSSDLDRVVLVYATTDPLNDAERRAADDVRAMGRERLGPLFDVEAISIETIYERAREEAINGQRLRIQLSADLKESSTDLLIGAIPLVQMYDFLKKYKAQTEDLDRLYEKNVRKFLGSRGKWRAITRSISRSNAAGGNPRKRSKSNTRKCLNSRSTPMPSTSSRCTGPAGSEKRGSPSPRTRRFCPEALCSRKSKILRSPAALARQICTQRTAWIWRPTSSALAAGRTSNHVNKRAFSFT